MEPLLSAYAKPIESSASTSFSPVDFTARPSPGMMSSVYCGYPASNWRMKGSREPLSSVTITETLNACSPSCSPERIGHVGSRFATVNVYPPALPLAPGSAGNEAVSPPGAVAVTIRRNTGASPSILFAKYHHELNVISTIPLWIIHTPSLIVLKGIFRTVTTVRFTHISAASTANGHQLNHSNSLSSKSRDSRTNGSALPIEE